MTDKSDKKTPWNRAKTVVFNEVAEMKKKGPVNYAKDNPGKTTLVATTALIDWSIGGIFTIAALSSAAGVYGLSRDPKNKDVGNKYLNRLNRRR